MFAAIQNRLKIDEATSSKDDVTPAYVLEELWQLVQSLPLDGNVALVDYTKKRLGNKSPVVKQKTLRVIKHICSKGSSDFKRSFQKQAAPVRELTHYNGEPDPFKGDVPNQKVRDSAKEALDAIFAATAVNNTTTPAPLQSRIQGFGGGSSDAISSTSSRGYEGGLGGSSGSRMTGFGNPKFEGSSGGSAGGAVTSPKSLLGSIGGKTGSGGTTRHAPFMMDQGGTIGSDDERPSGYQPRPLTVGTAPISASLSAPQLSANNGDEEARLVDGICAVGGVRAQPSREDLRLFVENIATLDGARVADLLRAKMEDASWQTVLRSLSAVEAVVQQGSTAACGEVAVQFQADPEPVRRAAASAQASVRQRAMSLLKLLGADDATAAPRAPQPAAVGDLMGGMDEPDPAAAAPRASAQDLLGDLMEPTPASALQSSALGGSMFDGLAVGSSAPAQGPAGQLYDMFHAGPSPAAAAAGAADMFGGLSLNAPGQSSASVPTRTAADPLAGLNMPSPAPSAGMENGGLFGRAAAATPQSNGGPSASGSGAGRVGSQALDADLFGGGFSQSTTAQSVGIPAQANGASTDIFGSNSSPTMITLVSPVKPSLPTQQFQYAQPQAAFQHNQPGLGGVPPQMYQQQAQQFAMYPGPQQAQQLHMQQYQMQQYQMQQMQLQQMQMQQMGMGGFGASLYQGQQQQQPYSGASNGPAVGADAFSSARSTLPSKADHLGGKKDSTFDFVGDHISKLRSAK